jgi:hypothetical protein
MAVATPQVGEPHNSKRYEIPFLEQDGSNFASWKRLTRRALRLRKLWTVVDGSSPKPAAGSTTLDDWLDKDEEVLGQIEFTLKPGPLNTISRTTTAKDAWDKLCDRFEGKGKLRVVHLLNEVFHTAFTDSEPFEGQLNLFLNNISLINQIKGQDVFDDELTAIAMINALPDSLETLRTVISSSPTITTDNVTNRILSDERRRIVSSGVGATAFFAKAARKAKKGDKGKSDDAKKHCTHCNIKGHDVTECRKLKREQEEAKTADSSAKAKTSKASAKIAVADDDPDESGSDSSVVRLLKVSHTPSTQGDLQDKWVIDSGASRTMSSNRSWFTHFTPLAAPIEIILGDNSSIQGTGVGRISVCMQAGEKWHCATLGSVLYVPNLHGNLLSVSHLTHCGAKVRFTKKNGCQIYDQQGVIVCEGKHCENLFFMSIHVVSPDSARIAIVHLDAFPSEGEEIAPRDLALAVHSTMSRADTDLWHRRLGHLDKDTVLKMVSKGMVLGMEITGESTHTAPCRPCLKGKQTHTEIGKSTETRANTALGRVFSDVCGKTSTCLHKGYKYFATFVDDMSRKVYVAGLRRKSDVAQHLKSFVAQTELETGQRLRVLRSDGGGEYTGDAVAKYLEDRGIKHEVTTPDTPQHNGVAECMNRTLLDKVRAMLHGADLPKSYWYDALTYAAFLHNVSPTRSLEDMTPEEAWSGNKPNVSGVCVFGCRVFVHIPDAQRGKLAAKSLVSTFLGFARNRKAYRLVHRPMQRFLESCDVVFDEGEAPTQVILEHNVAQNVAQNLPSSNNLTPAATTAAASASIPIPIPSIVITPPTETTNLLLAPQSDAEHAEHTPIPNARPKRITCAPIRDNDERYAVSSYGLRKRPDKHAHVAKADETSDPRSYAEAMAHPDAAEWEIVCDAEKRAFEHMEVYKVVPRPKGRKVVGSRWVFCIKRGPDSAILKYKACVVAQGFTQIEGVDYDETFTPVAKHTSLCIILALTAEHNLEVHQMDVKSAYLNGELKEEIYMEPPPGFDTPEGMVFRLVKAVYGTKQGGRVWYEDIRATLEAMGYHHTEADHAVFIRTIDGIPSILALYVDNITMASKDIGSIERDKEELKRHYQMTDLGEISWILGICITRDRKAGWVALSQEKYIREVLERFGKADTRPISTPALANERLTKLNSPEIETKPYQSAVGALMYPMLGTHPDIAYAMAALGRHAANPGTEHQHALDRAFKYLRATSDWELVFQRGMHKGSTLNGYVDADWASDVNDCKSTSGFVFMLAGGAVCWSSKKQASVALSSTEAEYIAAAHATKEVVWLRRLLNELGQAPRDPTLLHVDNQSAIAIVQNPEFHDRTKHIDVRYHFLRQKVDSRDILLTYLPTEDQIADALTKGLTCAKHEHFSREMGLRCTG